MEHQTDTAFSLIDDQNFSVSQFIKRIHLNQKRLHGQARIGWHRDHPKGPPFPRSRMTRQSDTAFVDEWEVKDHIIVPEDYDHINQPPFDLQQLDLVNRCGVDDRTLRHERDTMYQHYRGEIDSEAVVSIPPISASSSVLRTR